jgi:hypothetical protein
MKTVQFQTENVLKQTTLCSKMLRNVAVFFNNLFEFV